MTNHKEIKKDKDWTRSTPGQDSKTTRLLSLHTRLHSYPLHTKRTCCSLHLTLTCAAQSKFVFLLLNLAHASSTPPIVSGAPNQIQANFHTKWTRWLYKMCSSTVCPGALCTRTCLFSHLIRVGTKCQAFFFDGLSLFRLAWNDSSGRTFVESETDGSLSRITTVCEVTASGGGGGKRCCNWGRALGKDHNP